MPVETSASFHSSLDIQDITKNLEALSSPKETISIEQRGSFVDITVTATNEDKVTGRHHLNEGMRKAHILLIQNELKAGRSIVFFKIDMRKLKNLNDNYGHKIGDEGLRTYDGTLEERLAAQMTGKAIRFMELHRMQSGGDEWGGFLSADQETARSCAELLTPILTDIPFSFQDSDGKQVQELLSAEHGVIIVNPANLPEQMRAIREVVAPFSLAPTTLEESFTDFGQMAELYELMDQYAEYQLLKSKEEQHWLELRSTDVLFRQVYNELISEGKLAPLSEYNQRKNETLLSYEGFIIFSKRFKLKLALIMSRRLDTQMAYYYIGMVEVITRMGEKMIRGESLTESDLDLLGVQEELAEQVMTTDHIVTP